MYALRRLDDFAASRGELRREIRALRLSRASRTLFSPRASVTLTPTSDDTFKVRAAVSRRAVAPGARGVHPARQPACGCRRSGRFHRYRRAAASRPSAWTTWKWRPNASGRAGSSPAFARFRQQVDDQLVTLFGAALPARPPPSLGHYYVASAGDFGAVRLGRERQPAGSRPACARPWTTRMSSRRGSARLPTTWPTPGARWRGRSCGERADSRPDDDGRQHAAGHRYPRVRRSTRSTRDLPTQGTAAIARGRAVRRAGEPVAAVPELRRRRAGRCWWRSGACSARSCSTRRSTTKLLVVRPPKRIVGGVTVRF